MRLAGQCTVSGDLAAVSLFGGLGNQLFQNAVTQALQRDPELLVAVDVRLGRIWGNQLIGTLREEAVIAANPWIRLGGEIVPDRWLPVSQRGSER